MAQSKKKKRKSSKAQKNSSGSSKKGTGAISSRETSSDQPPPVQRGFLWWVVLASILYGMVTLVTTHAAEFNRVHQKTTSENTLTLEHFSGQTTFVGWPIRWLVFHREATKPNEDAPFRFAWGKVSVVALALDILAVVATVVGFRQTSALVRTKKGTGKRAVVLFLCLGYLVAMPYLAVKDYFGELPGGIVEEKTSTKSKP
ncbi:MAG: hypothetical protein ACFCD0_20355 [Gemmataceae bacterium]